MYVIGWEQKDIARVLKTSERSIGVWKDKFKWQEKRSKKNMTRDNAEEDVWVLINYQTTALKMRTEKYQQKFDDKEVDDLPLLDKGDIDALQKLFTTIKSKQLEWATVANLVKELTEYLQLNNLSLAKQFLPLADDFLNVKRSQL